MGLWDWGAVLLAVAALPFILAVLLQEWLLIGLDLSLGQAYVLAWVLIIVFGGLAYFGRHIWNQPQ